MKHAARILTVFSAALVLLWALWLPIPTAVVRADFGDYSGDSDWGDSDSDWGDSDSDWGSSSDSSWDDYDRDSGSSSSERRGEDKGTGKSVPRLFILFMIIVGTVILVALIKEIVKAEKNTRKRKEAIRRAEEKHRAEQERERLRGRPLEEYTELDPGFDAEAFLKRLAELYVRMQACWTAKDIESLRPDLSDRYFAEAERLLQKHIEEHNTNYTEDPVVRGVWPVGFRQEDGLDVITVKLRCRIVDYTLDDRTGELLRGSRTARKYMVYEWELVRPSGEFTVLLKDRRTGRCPQCGTETEINQNAKCPSCGTVFTSGTYDFVLRGVKALSQRTVMQQEQ